MSVQRGFTLIELMVTIAIAAILIAIATPFFRDVIANHRLNTISLELADALALARSESIKRNRSITFCRTIKAAASSKQGSIDSSKCETGNPWQYWLIRQNAAGTDEASVIKRGNISSLSHSIKITAANIDNSQLNFNTDGLVRSNGVLISDAQLIICAKNLSKNAVRTLNIGAAGQISLLKSDGACE